MKLKKELRKEYLSKRKELSDQDILQLDQALFQEFKAYSLAGMRFIHFFLPIQKYREPNTLRLIHWILKDHPEINIVLSKSNIETNLMEHYLWDNQQEIKGNRWGIDEPQGGTKVLPQQLDAVIIPLLAFDKKGNRVGYGKGFYDRFLADCRKDCKKIGLSHFNPIEEIEDINPYDAPLDACITPNKTWLF